MFEYLKDVNGQPETASHSVNLNDLLGRDIFVLMADGDGTMRSNDEPFGVAVTTEEEAIRFANGGGVGYTQSYQKLRLFEDKDDAIAWKYPKS